MNSKYEVIGFALLFVCIYIAVLLIAGIITIVSVQQLILLLTSK